MIKISAHQYKRHETELDDSNASNAASVSNERGIMEKHHTVAETREDTCHDCTQERITCMFVLRDNDSITPLHFPGKEACFAGSAPIQQHPTDSCLVCMEHPQDAVLLDCGHSGLCVACACRLWERDRRCPLCREGIAGIMRVVAEEEGGAKVRPVTGSAAPPPHAREQFFRLRHRASARGSGTRVPGPSRRRAATPAPRVPQQSLL